VRRMPNESGMYFIMTEYSLRICSRAFRSLSSPFALTPAKSDVSATVASTRVPRRDAGASVVTTARHRVSRRPTARPYARNARVLETHSRARKRHGRQRHKKASLFNHLDTNMTVESTTDRVLMLERAYQGRAMFVKVSCKAGESPVELSHHPELRFRFIPRPHDGAPLIANAVQFEVRPPESTKRIRKVSLKKVFFFPPRRRRRHLTRLMTMTSHDTDISHDPFKTNRQACEEVELLMRRDRAGCWITMDEVFFFETCAFEVWCEKERWVSGRVIRSKDHENAKTRAWSLEIGPAQSALMTPGVERRERGVVHGTAPPNAVAVFGDFPTDSTATRARAHAHASTPLLTLELCLVGTCAGDHLAMTRECDLQAWKVVSPRSFVPQPAMHVISEEISSSESWSEDDVAGDYERQASFSTPRRCGVDETPSHRTRCGPLAELATGGQNSSDDVSRPDDDDVLDAATEGSSRPAPRSIVPWKRDLVAFDKAEVLRNVRKRYEDLMREYHDSGSDLRSASDELFAGELTWFSAGIRIGVGMGLGACLGLGLGVGILVNGYRSSRDRLSGVRQALRLR